MREHQAMLAAIKAALKPGGRLVIVESVMQAQRNIAREAQEGRHQLAPHFVQQDALAAGFAIVRFEEAFTRPGTMSPDTGRIDADRHDRRRPAGTRARSRRGRCLAEARRCRDGTPTATRYDGGRSRGRVRRVHAPVRARSARPAGRSASTSARRRSTLSGKTRQHRGCRTTMRGASPPTIRRFRRPRPTSCS